MKRIVIATSAIVLMLSINIAFARAPVPLLEPMDADPVITQILTAIGDLYNQVSNLSGRMVNVERSSRDDLVIVDADGTRIGILTGLSTYDTQWWPYNPTTEEWNAAYTVWNEQIGGFLVVTMPTGRTFPLAPDTAGDAFYTTPDCTGGPYSETAPFKVSRINPYITKERWNNVIIIQQTTGLVPQSIWDMETDTCITATSTAPRIAGPLRTVTLPTYTVPLRIVKD